jgi:hypothetical protein
MWLPRVRFTVRRLMVVVAVVALVLGTIGYDVRLRKNWHRLARYHADWVGGLTTDTQYENSREIVTYYKLNGERMTDLEYRLRQWNEQMMFKCFERSRHPWQHFAPNPPEPK